MDMKKTMLLLVPALAGCLGSAPKPPVNWTIDIETGSKVAFAAVCAPYGGQRFAVLRADGSIAFDPCNSFAASPGSIIKDAVVGRKGEGALFVRRLALDCRAEGRRRNAMHGVRIGTSLLGRFGQALHAVAPLLEWNN